MTKKLGINGLGRIGKLLLWQFVGRKYFQELYVNLGRPAGTSLYDIAHYIERDSTYGWMHNFLFGAFSKELIHRVDEKKGLIEISGVKVYFLYQNRNPKDINWADLGVRLVVDTTGKFLDPTLPPDHPGGSLRGHFEAGAEKIVISAPFKIKDKMLLMPADCVTTVMGINENDFNPQVHRIVSNASCTTTCLAHMVKPLILRFGIKKILLASMATVHAVTSSQEVLDRLPEAGKVDLRKNRSVMNNIILTTTGATKTLALVIPEVKQIGFMAESVRVSLSTGSLVILTVCFNESLDGDPKGKETINEIFRKTALADSRGYLQYSVKQNVSSDIIGWPRAAAIIEGSETHTRTSTFFVPIDGNDHGFPVTQAVIYGWYDNEMGSYVGMLRDRAVSVAGGI